MQGLLEHLGNRSTVAILKKHETVLDTNDVLDTIHRLKLKTPKLSEAFRREGKRKNLIC
jgi:hypothetical protein